MDNAAAAQAVARFGLGRAAWEPLPTDPQTWLRAQLGADAAASPRPDTAEALAALLADRQTKPPPGQSQTRALYRRDALAALTGGLTTSAPFRERLVWFWTNHFTVSVRRGQCAGLIGPFIADSIRPHVTGRFADMLRAVVRHPAMLLYLDNVSSVGPDSRAGRNGKRGLNENLARECLELHTASPASGYTQADVISFARLLTGWSIELRVPPIGFRFRPAAHEPGEQTLLGRRFPEGEQGGLEALDFLATHPATYRHLATQMVRHFVADDPQPDAVRAIFGVLRETGGNLGAAAAELVRIPSAWHPAAKVRTPMDLATASLRALGVTTAPPRMMGALALMGQPVWAAAQPDGWSDQASDWIAPEAMMRRIDFAYAIAGRAGEHDPDWLADIALGPLLRPGTQEMVHRAGSRREAVALLFSSPEFQRR